MNKKDIALTVGGVLATMILAYLLYRLQKRDAAQAAQAASDAAQAAQDAQVANSQNEASLSAQLPQVNLSGISNTSLATSSEGSTDTTASNGTDSETAIDGLLTSIISSFASSIAQPQAGSVSNASIIPTLQTNPQQALSSIPTSINQINQPSYFVDPGFNTSPTTVTVTNDSGNTSVSIPGVKPIYNGTTILSNQSAN